MKKVLFTSVLDSFMMLFNLPLLKYFKEQGYEVHVATSGDDEIPYCDKKFKICLERSPFKVNNLKAIKQLKNIIDSEHYDIIHTHTPMGSAVTRLAAKEARKNGTRVIYTAHGFHFFTGAPLVNWLIYYPVEKYLSKYTDTLITINMEDYERAKTKFKKCKDIQYVPGVGIDEDKFNFEMTDEEKHELRSSLGIKDEDFVMIFPAELNKNKNQIMLINAMEELVKNHKDIHLLLPGKDSLDGYYQQVTKEKGLENNIHFLGFRNDIPKLLKIANLSVASSQREGLPVNLLEAMYVGLPIIATNCRGQRDLVKDGYNGYIVEINDVDKLVESIEKIYSNTELRNELINNSKIDIQNYLLDRIMDYMKKIYFKKKTIIHLLASNSFSGAENVVCTIINNTKDEFNHYYCSPDGMIKDKLRELNIKYISLKKLSLKEVKKIVNDFEADIIHAHDFKASIIASLLDKKYCIISQLHKNDPKMKKISLKSLMYLLSATKFKKIIGVSNSVINEYIFKKFIINKYVTLYNLVDIELLNSKAIEFKVNKKYDYFYFGRLSEEKNPLEFIDIIEKLSKNKKINAVMIGDGPLKKDCIELIENKGLDIDVVGFQSNPFPYIIAANIGIMPSRFEGFGLAAVECCYLKKAVFNSGVGGLKEIFAGNEYYICKSIDEYIEKIDNYKGDYARISETYSNKNTYKRILLNCYQGEKNK